LGGTDERFTSRLLGKHVTKTNALESLVIARYVRGLSTRDVEASLADALGPRSHARQVDGLADLHRDRRRVRRLAASRPVPCRT